MGVVITIDDIRAYAEVDYIINHMNQKYIDKVPKKMKDFFATLKDPNHEVKINPYVPLQNQGLQRYTLEIIALLHLKYWCEDEERKQELYDIMLKNQRRLEAQMKEKYSVDKLFSNSSSKLEETEEQEPEENDFSRPRVVQRYSAYEQNNDIQDFTDHVDESTSDNVDESQDNNLPVQNATENVKGFFQKLIDKLQGIFKKA